MRVQKRSTKMVGKWGSEEVKCNYLARDLDFTHKGVTTNWIITVGPSYCWPCARYMHLARKLYLLFCQNPTTVHTRWRPPTPRICAPEIKKEISERPARAHFWISDDFLSLVVSFQIKMFTCPLPMCNKTGQINPLSLYHLFHYCRRNSVELMYVKDISYPVSMYSRMLKIDTPKIDPFFEKAENSLSKNWPFFWKHEKNTLK